jgi:lipoprotein-anchoring transpeptidase ErfK/SrfK
MGHFPISAKPYIVHYAGTGYDMGYVPYNLRFQPHIYIHYAPWHNNFGRQGSRGCVNVNLESAKWIYNWAEVGTMVSVIE